MTVTVEMTEKEIEEFLIFRKEKQINNDELSSALKRVRTKMNELSERLLKAVRYDGTGGGLDTIMNVDKKFLNEAVQLANDWYC